MSYENEAHGDEDELDETYMDMALREVVDCVLDHGYYPEHGPMKFDLEEFLFSHLRYTDMVLDLAERLEAEGES